MAEYKLELKGICKSFPGVKALDNVQLSVRPGTVHALMGENGAGKSTLMKCLFGIYKMDAGEIYLDGEKIEVKDPDDAMSKGIAMVHQELQPVLARSVGENLFLGRFPTKNYGPLKVIDHKKMYEDTKMWLDEVGMDFDPKAQLGSLSIGQMQSVEIAKAVSHQAKVVIFDEPTSSLSDKEVDALFRIMNDLRNKVVLETDGKLMSGRDVVIAAMLGAEEFGFATAPLVTMGCVMMRVCNLDTCPVGVATQNPELRKRFRGKPEYVINFMKFIAEEVREYMAKLGVKTVDELVGRADLLKRRDNITGRAANVDLSNILNTDFCKEKICYHEKNLYNFELEKTLDEKVLVKKFAKALDDRQKRSIEVDVTNTDRSFGTIFGSEITKKYPEGLEEDTFTIKCNGAGGQSFGAFIPKGLTLELVGDSNDYFGKGLSGGKLIVYPPKGSTFKESENIIIGNVALYGATSGKAFINGVAGERFCVRNSGATAVVEGVGEHGCEYMTGGCVVILGTVGKNFAAGMSGGIAYVLDEQSDLYTKMNKELVFMREVTDKYDVLELKTMIQEHVAYTNSARGKEVLDNFGEYLPKFKKIMSYDYATMLKKIVQMEEKGLSSEQAKIEAFYAIAK